MMESNPVPRLVPERPFPSYSFVPGLFPHPFSDPGGHSFGQRPVTVPALTEETWRDNRDYLFGLDLFNHGYYWEAHETWEGLWHACGRAGLVGDFLKGLIQLTAAGVKVRQGMPRGVAGLAQGAAELFEKVRDALGPDTRRFLGLDLDGLIYMAQELKAQPERDPGTPGAPVERVLSLVLLPSSEEP
jgi:predicted metal-dependent hydrolase